MRGEREMKGWGLFFFMDMYCHIYISKYIVAIHICIATLLWISKYLPCNCQEMEVADGYKKGWRGEGVFFYMISIYCKIFLTEKTVGRGKGKYTCIYI